jgi:hypothetical protein
LVEDLYVDGQIGVDVSFDSVEDGEVIFVPDHVFLLLLIFILATSSLPPLLDTHALGAMVGEGDIRRH